MNNYMKIHDDNWIPLQSCFTAYEVGFRVIMYFCFSFFFQFMNFLMYFLIEGSLLYNIMLVSAMHQHESAIGIHMSPPSWNSLPLPTPSHPLDCQRAQFESWVMQPVPAGCLICGSVRVSVLLAPFVPPSPPPRPHLPQAHTSALCVCISSAALRTGSSVPSF